MKTDDQVDEFIVMETGSAEVMTCDGFADAFIGIVERYGQPAVALYDRDRILEILVERDGLTPEEAAEFFDYNVQGAWVGDTTPAFATLMNRAPSESLDEPDMPLFPGVL